MGVCESLIVGSWVCYVFMCVSVFSLCVCVCVFVSVGPCVLVSMWIMCANNMCLGICVLQCGDAKRTYTGTYWMANL